MGDCWDPLQYFGAILDQVVKSITNQKYKINNFRSSISIFHIYNIIYIKLYIDLEYFQSCISILNSLGCKNKLIKRNKPHLLHAGL